MSARRGYSVAIVGPDGVGKSTLAAGLRQRLADRPVRRVKVSMHSTAWARGPRPLRWLIRTLRGLVILVAARIAVWRGEVVLWDRHPIEDRALAREGRSVLGTGRRWLTRVAGTPDVMLVLDAPVEVLEERDQEHDRPTLDRLRTGYLHFGADHDALVLDAARKPEAIQADAAAALERFEQTGSAQLRS